MPVSKLIDATSRAAAITFVALALTIALLLVPRPSVAAPAGAATQPAANAVLASSPRELVLAAPASAKARSAHVDVYGSDRKRVAALTARRVAGRPGALVAAVPRRLAQGVYTVVWRVPSAGRPDASRTSSSAFAINAGGAAAARVEQVKPHDELKALSRALPRWLAFAAIMVFIGALALRLLVTAPATRRLSGDERAVVGAASDRSLLVLAGAAIALFVPATLAELVNDATDEEAGLSFWQSIRPGAVADFLGGSPDGRLWELRLGLTALAALVVVPAAVAALRGGWQHRRRRVAGVMIAGFALGTAELVVRVIPTEAPPSWPRAIFTWVLDWGHMFFASIWIGGLAGLAVLAAFLRVPAERRGAFFSIALRRFSLVATICVGAMILTGLWTAWIHVGPPGLLFTTLYGQTLLVKLVLVLILVGLGAFNQLWLLPRIRAIRAGADGAVTLSGVLRRFRVVVVAEVVVGLLILLVVPFLSGSARRQDFQAKAADLSQTLRAGDASVRLRPSAAQPGVTDYDISAPGATGPVAVRFASPQPGVPETRVLATPRGGDDYRVAGIYTPTVGRWRVAVATGGGAVATFGLGVSATQPELPKPDPPIVRASTWAWGLGELAAVILVLTGAQLMSRRRSRRRTPALEAATATGSAGV